ncbi:hypothetical protein CYMTET_36583 [Cymbomonas tetramitiformis]|uniref:ATP-dependent DNA helicase n=1 Tax=Cymbomonas tetramitiformis TaxID=36881 RepID=A0AAE0F7F8_9CHLO|nr:hypothetical protein CYMTET_36583 [Cymbomonas tetramitiformis]
MCPNVYDAVFGTGPIPADHAIFKCRLLLVPKCVYDDAALFARLQQLCARRLAVEGMPMEERDTWGGLAIMVSKPPPPPPMTSLWDGGPGTGKSYVAKALCTAANFLSGHDGTVVCCAPSGVAAALIPGARTIHNLGDMKPTEACRAVPLKAMNPGTKAEYAARLGPGTAYILLIDEISMVEACLYGHLQDRCAEIRRVGDQAKTEWGGLAVVAVGDFGQLAPVGKSLYKQALNVFSGQRSFDVAEKAGRLFQAIRRYPLTEQVRAASDPDHVRFIERCRSEERPITQSDLDRLKVLTASDVQMDRDWLFATVAVTGNRQRQAINDVRARHFARLSGQPIIRWKRPIATTLLDSRHEDVIRSEFPELTGTFVAGAPGIILNNDLNPSRGLANGTPAKFHSLILRDDSRSTDAAKINNANPGEEVWIEPPYAVNVLIEHLDSTNWSDRATLAPELRDSASEGNMREHVTRPRSIVLPVKISKRLEELPVNRASRKIEAMEPVPRAIRSLKNDKGVAAVGKGKVVLVPRAIRSLKNDKGVAAVGKGKVMAPLALIPILLSLASKVYGEDSWSGSDGKQLACPATQLDFFGSHAKSGAGRSGDAFKYEHVGKVGDKEVDVKLTCEGKALDGDTHTLVGKFANIHLEANSEEIVEFKFVDSETHEPVEVESFYLTFFDITEGQSLAVYGYDKFVLSEDSTIKVQQRSETLQKFHGSVEDSIDLKTVDPAYATEAEQKSSITFFFAATTSFTVKMNTQSSSEDFAFTGQSPLLQGCGSGKVETETESQESAGLSANTAGEISDQFCLAVGSKAKCDTFTRQKAVGSQEEAEQLAIDGGYVGYAFNADGLKVQLFTMEECANPTILGKNAEAWYIYKNYGCPYVSPPPPTPPPPPPSPPPAQYCLSHEGEKCLDYARMKAMESQEAAEQFAVEQGYTGYSYTAEYGTLFYNSGQCLNRASADGYDTYLLCSKNEDGETVECASGYDELVGHVSEDTPVSVEDCDACAAKCTADSECHSYECSSTSSLCYLHSQYTPLEPAFYGYKFCSDKFELDLNDKKCLSLSYGKDSMSYETAFSPVTSIPKEHPKVWGNSSDYCGNVEAGSPIPADVTFMFPKQLQHPEEEWACEPMLGAQGFYAHNFPNHDSANVGISEKETIVFYFIEDSIGQTYLVETIDQPMNTDGGEVWQTIDVTPASVTTNMRFVTQDDPCKGEHCPTYAPGNGRRCIAEEDEEGWIEGQNITNDCYEFDPEAGKGSNYWTFWGCCSDGMVLGPLPNEDFCIHVELKQKSHGVNGGIKVMKYNGPGEALTESVDIGLNVAYNTGDLATGIDICRKSCDSYCSLLENCGACSGDQSGLCGWVPEDKACKHKDEETSLTESGKGFIQACEQCTDGTGCPSPPTPFPRPLHLPATPSPPSLPYTPSLQAPSITSLPSSD